MIISLCLLVAGAAVCNYVKGDCYDDEMTFGPDDTMKFETENDNDEQATYEYFLELSLDQQEAYYRENCYLRYWIDDACKGLTDDRYMNAKHAAEIARVMGKRFTDKNRTY